MKKQVCQLQILRYFKDNIIFCFLMGKVEAAVLCVLLLSIGTLGEDVDYSDTDNWGETCTGEAQSPVNINPRDVEPCPQNMWFRFVDMPCTEFSYTDEGQSAQVSAPDASHIAYAFYNTDQHKLYFDVYSLTDFEFHMASEHTIDGNTYDLEMHLNHQRNSDYADKQTLIDSVIEELGISTQDLKTVETNNQKAVVSILFEKTDTVEGDVFQSFIPVTEDGEISGNTILKQAFSCITSKTFYFYEGSLTTPPCTEEVNWFVLRTPLPITSDSYDLLRPRINSGEDNNRPMQEINERQVYVLSENACPTYSTYRQADL